MRENIELSVVLPCLNEEDTIAKCIAKIKKIFETHNIHGEVIVVDNGSVDKSVEIAKSHNVKIIFEKNKGYGSALKTGISNANGKFILMGDADDSYDFLDIMKFLNKIREGYDLVQGCRLPSGGGHIEKNAMPWSHRYIGNPILSFLVRFLHNAPYNDVYCGMRIFRKSSFDKIKHFSKGMEFAIENLIKFNAYNLKIAQVPITLFKDGRVNSTSHLRTIRDGLRTLKLMLICSPKWLYFFPALLFLILSIHNIYTLDFYSLSEYKLFKEITISGLFFIISFQIFFVGIFASLKSLNLNFSKDNTFLDIFFKIFKLDQAVIISSMLLILSIVKIIFEPFVIFDKKIDILIFYFTFYFSITLFFNSLLISFLEFDNNEK